MCKKITGTIIILIMMFIFTVPVMAYPDLDDPAFGNVFNGIITENPASESKTATEETENTSENLFEKLLAEIIRNPNIKETEEFLAKVGVENRDALIVSGELINTEENEGKFDNKNVWGILAIYNKEKNIYEEYAGISGQGRWSIEDSGSFSGSFEFERSGEYKFKIIIFIKPLIELSEEDLIINLNYLRKISESNMENGEISTIPEIDKSKVVLEPGKNLQISYFTKSILNKYTREKLVNSKNENSFNLDSIIKRLLEAK